MSMSADYKLKFVLIGSSGVGKTTIVHQFLGREVKIFPATIGFQNYQGVVTFEEVNKTAAIEIMDTAGEEKFNFMLPSSYFRKVHGVLLVYDVTCRKSFLDLNAWKALYESLSPSNIIVMLIGNKCDCSTREVTFDEGSEYANHYQMFFMETSALANHNIQEVFQFVAQHACCLLDESQMDNITTNDELTSLTNIEDITPSENGNKKSKCSMNFQCGINL